MQSKEYQNTLRRCPFCGGEAIINVIEPHDHVFVDLPPYDGGAFIECLGCTCAMAGKMEKEVIEAWNTRKPMDKVVERITEVKDTVFLADEILRPEQVCDIIYEIIEIVKGMKAE